MSYKVGDWVKVKNAREDTHMIGKIAKVRKADELSVWLEGAGFPWNQDSESLEPRPFQVGDKVRISNKHDMKYGKEFTIQGPFDAYDWKLNRNGGKTDWYANNDELELITPVEEIEKNDDDEFYSPELRFAIDASRLPTTTFMVTREPQDYKPKKEGIMSMLRDIPKQIKKLLSPNMRAMYKLGWINSELEMTDSGLKAMKEILLSEYEEELGKMAQKEVKRIEKEEE